MPAAYWKIEIDQGETWRMVLRLKNPDDDTAIDLTGYTARMQVRESLTSPSPLLSLTTDTDGGITVEPADGRLTLTVSDDDTAAWTWRYGLYDLEIESADGETTRLLKGEVEVNAEITR